MPDVSDGGQKRTPIFASTPTRPGRWGDSATSGPVVCQDGGTRFDTWGLLVEETSDSQGVYAIDGDAMKQAIGWWLSPVVDKLKEISGGYTQAHAEVKAAHDTEAAGWFGGRGNNEVRWATISFLNETEWQLRQLADEQTQLAASLEEYEAMLLQHINGAKAMDDRNAERFRSIERELDEMGWR